MSLPSWSFRDFSLTHTTQPTVTLLVQLPRVSFGPTPRVVARGDQRIGLSGGQEPGFRLGAARAASEAERVELTSRALSGRLSEHQVWVDRRMGRMGCFWCLLGVIDGCVVV